MYYENAETLSISLPTFLVHFINDYMTTYKNQSQSQVIQEALQLLREQEQKREYRQSNTPFEKVSITDQLDPASRDTVQELEAFQQSNPFIHKTTGICGGRACIAHTRLTVWNLVVWHQLGLSDQEILAKYPQLTQRDLEAAWNYSAHNRLEIEQDIEDNLSDDE